MGARRCCKPLGSRGLDQTRRPKLFCAQPPSHRNLPALFLIDTPGAVQLARAKTAIPQEGFSRPFPAIVKEADFARLRAVACPSFRRAAFDRTQTAGCRGCRSPTPQAQGGSAPVQLEKRTPLRTVRSRASYRARRQGGSFPFAILRPPLPPTVSAEPLSDEEWQRQYGYPDLSRADPETRRAAALAAINAAFAEIKPGE